MTLFISIFELPNNQFDITIMVEQDLQVKKFRFYAEKKERDLLISLC